MSYYILDIEANGLKPTKLLMVGVLNYETDEFVDYNGETMADGLMVVDEADIVFVFNRSYDINNIQKLTENMIEFKKVIIVDVLELSRKHVKFLPNHKLKTWGEYLNYHKGDYNQFEYYEPEMGIYCERDCRLTKKIFDFIREMLLPSRDILLEALQDVERVKTIL